jgi:protoporphyrin/coproporphyrin ferrochelatase
MPPAYDSLLVVAFGGPEKRDDVIPFLENVLRGRNVPQERLLEVAEHYYQFDGVSPLNQQVRDLIAALESEFHRQGIDLSVYWGNRNWHPLLTETIGRLIRDGRRRTLALVLSSFSSYSGCRQYREDITRACGAAGPGAPTVDKIRVWYNHPQFIAANVERIREGLKSFGNLPSASTQIAYTAHSIPKSQADTCDYERQLRESCRLISEQLGVPEDHWQLVYQSRSGRPQDPWLGPDICEHLRVLSAQGGERVIVHPVGFLSDHVEVLYDLDEEAASVARDVGLRMVRTPTVGTHPRFVSMLCELIEERLREGTEKRAAGSFPPNHDVCPVDCCPRPSLLRRP